MTSAAMGSGEGDLRKVEKGMRAIMTRMPGQVHVARSKGDVVGAMRMVESPRCQPSAGMRVVMPILMYATPGGTAGRVLHFRGEWRRRDPEEHHFHLDPPVVVPAMQGRGIGSRLLTRFCQVVDTTEIFGITNWFMWRGSRRG